MIMVYDGVNLSINIVLKIIVPYESGFQILLFLLLYSVTFVFVERWYQNLVVICLRI